MESHKRKIKVIYLPSVIIFLVLFSMCSTPKNNPYQEITAMPTKDLENGRILYNKFCATCHPGGMSGLGPAIINKPLPKFLMKFQIRNGVGVMPAFNDNVINDEQVDNITEYLVYLRKTK